MKESTAAQILGRECSEEISRFEAYVHALGDDDIEEAARLFDQFAEADHRPLIEFMRCKLDSASKPPVQLAPTPEKRRSTPNEPIIAMSEHSVAISRWGDEDEHPADDAALKAFRATTRRDRRELDGRRLTVSDCRRLARSGSRAAPRRRESRPGPSRRRSLTRASSRSADRGDDGPSDEPPARRLCENNRCEADISHRPALARYCNDACQQEAYRDRLTHEHLDELAGTVAVGLSCTCSPKRNFVIGGMCFHCGRPRGVITRAWLGDDLHSRQLVARAPARRKPRYGDRKRKPVREFVDTTITEAAA